jgi:hypothetical protein
MDDGRAAQGFKGNASCNCLYDPEAGLHAI